jgi:L-lysine 6-transaminase
MVRVDPQAVHSTLARTMLVEGYPFVLDLERSHGQRLYDALTQREYLDFFTFYASRPVAFNHPRTREPEFEARLVAAGRMKPSNCDIYTPLLAEFVETFRLRAMGPRMRHLFFIDGGALAVENALKAAFDWKARKNAGRGRDDRPGQVIHFRHAFHGRTGYTLSLTNTFDPRKTQYFPKFDWPRIDSPAAHFPLDAMALADVEAAEAAALQQIDRVYDRLGQDDIACIIVEPIQAEGGDRYLRKPFLERLRTICDEREAILVFDEVQTGMGLTGSMWYYEQLGVVPDVVAFAKKAQTGGIMAGPRFDEVDSVFKVKSRISSTFGGNLVDFVRCTRYLDIIAEEKLVENARRIGAHLLERLEALAVKHAGVDNARGAGLMLAFDAPDTALRDRIIGAAREEGLIVLSCGERSVRLRPALDVSLEEAEVAAQILDRAIGRSLA